MFDELDEFIYKHTMSKERVLELVDEYDLYCHFLGYVPEIKVPYSSPIRDDDSVPSFSIFPADNIPFCEFGWKDSGRGESGDIFKLIMILNDLRTLDEVFRLIDREFGLGFHSGGEIHKKPIRYKRPKIRKASNIRIDAKPMDNIDYRYWGQFNISPTTLSKYKVFSVNQYWMYDDQKYPIVPKGLCYAYLVNSRHKIYRPYARDKKDKFRNDFNINCIEGFEQLTFTADTLIITKSLKEIMWFCDNIPAVESISGRSESTMIPEEVMEFLFTMYKNVIVFLDNDAAGWTMMYKYQKKYGNKVKITSIPNCLMVPYSSQFSLKDPTDVNARLGNDVARNLVSYCINYESNLRPYHGK